jgi:hypothetical protein
VALRQVIPLPSYIGLWTKKVRKIHPGTDLTEAESAPHFTGLFDKENRQCTDVSEILAATKQPY